MISGSSILTKYIAWYDFRILYSYKVYCLVWFQDPLSLESILPDFVPDFVLDFFPDFFPDFVGVLDCVSAPPDNIFIYGPWAQMTMTARSASKFCARNTGNRSQSPNIFDLDLISRVIPGQIEPWPECQPYVYKN